MFTPESSDRFPELKRGALIVAGTVGVLYGLFFLIAVRLREREVPLSGSAGVAALVLIGVSPYVLPMCWGVWASLIASESKHSSVRLAVQLSAVSLIGAAPFLLEGLICYIFAVPYSVAVSAAAAWLLTIVLRRFGAKGGGAGAALLLLVGTSQFWPEQRAPYQLTDSVVISQPQEKVFASMRRLELPLESRTPLWMQWLLPRPLHISGGGTDVGAKRRVVFENGVLLATVTSVEAPHRFGLKLEVEESGREFFDHWGTFGDSEFRFEALSPERTRVVHATWFQPQLRMHRFFAPLELYLGHAIQATLLEAYAQAIEENELNSVRVSAAR